MLQLRLGMLDMHDPDVLLAALVWSSGEQEAVVEALQAISEYHEEHAGWISDDSRSVIAVVRVRGHVNDDQELAKELFFDFVLDSHPTTTEDSPRPWCLHNITLVPPQRRGLPYSMHLSGLRQMLADLTEAQRARGQESADEYLDENDDYWGEASSASGDEQVAATSNEDGDAAVAEDIASGYTREATTNGVAAERSGDDGALQAAFEGIIRLALSTGTSRQAIDAAYHEARSRVA